MTRVTSSTIGRSAWRGRPALLALWALLPAVLLMSCSSPRGSNSSPSGASSSSTSGSSASTSPPTTATSSDISLTRYPFTISFPDGYSATGTFLKGALQRAHTVIINGVSLGDACGYNRQTDAIIPFEVKFTNTTQGYELSPGVTVEASGGSTANNGNGVDITDGGAWTWNNAEIDGGTLTCNPEGGGSVPIAGFNWSNLSDNDTAYGYGYLIISGFYTPQSPNGDPGLLSGAVLNVSFNSDVTNNNDPTAINVPSGNGSQVVTQYPDGPTIDVPLT